MVVMPDTWASLTDDVNLDGGPTAPCMDCGSPAYLSKAMPDQLWEAISGLPSRTGADFAGTRVELLAAVDMNECLCDACIEVRAERLGISLRAGWTAADAYHAWSELNQRNP